MLINAVITDLQPSGKCYAYPNLFRYDNFPPLIYTDEGGLKSYKLGLVDIDHLVFLKPGKVPFSSIESLVGLFPFHVSDIIDVIKKYSHITDEEINSLHDVSSFKKEQLKRQFENYDNFLRKKNENSCSNKKEIKLSEADNKDIEKQDIGVKKAIELVVNIINSSTKGDVRNAEALSIDDYFFSDIVKEVFFNGMDVDMDKAEEFYGHLFNIKRKSLRFLFEKGYIYLNTDLPEKFSKDMNSVFFFI
ncbi:hypothetical protein [Candidatus Sororendozoicomonas aggregata]|uniref:hypothetical protein n=1 Tax=Candidatus Sororendozoicomonas aggregata TaxID=3073239 RepID=UPI002ED0DD3C